MSLLGLVVCLFSDLLTAGHCHAGRFRQRILFRSFRYELGQRTRGGSRCILGHHWLVLYGICSHVEEWLQSTGGSVEATLSQPDHLWAKEKALAC